ncbi:Ig-like domain-containing protein [Cardiobacterium sp. AH-315-I02]|nr:Ig-like domain-containing protein [Cardiobacterium sp. AH-315-I02]
MNNRYSKTNRFIALSAVTLSLIACGGGGGSSGSNPTTVSSTSPANNAIDVARNSTIIATFNQDILNTSVNATSFTLAKSSGENTAGSVSFDGLNNVASFTANDRLALLSSYTVTLSTAITDLSGNALASNHNWSFTTADGTWQGANKIEIEDGRAIAPQIAFDNNDNAFAVWQQRDNSDIFSIRVSRFDGTSWGNVEQIEAGAGNSYSPQIAIDTNGNALVVWQQRDANNRGDILASRFNGAKWSSAVAIETGEFDAQFPQIVIDNNGNALAVWLQHDGTRFNILANRFDGNSWGTNAELIDRKDTSAQAPQIAIDNNGNAFAIWQQSGIQVSRFDGTTWGGAVSLGETTLSDFPQIAFDNSGNALAAWVSFGSTSKFRVFVSHFDGTNWGEPELFETDDTEQHARSPQITFDNNGNVFVVWYQENSNSLFNIWANRYDGTSWAGAELIESNDIGSASLPQIAVDNNGNALVVWGQWDGNRNNVWANRFNGTSWGDPDLIEIENISFTAGQQIAIDTNGNAFAVWQQEGSNNIFNIWTNRFE